MLRADTDNIVFKKTGRESVLLDFRTGVYFHLNESAVFIWKQLAKTPSNKAEIVNLLLTRYSVSRELATKDVTRLLRHWKKSGIVVECL